MLSQRARYRVGGILAAGMLFFTPVAHAAPSDEVDIPDANLRACINEELEQNSDSPVTREQLGSVEYLYCDRNAPGSLEGLGGADSLVHLILSGNKVQDFSPLSDLPNLRNLYLVEPDLDALSGAPEFLAVQDLTVRNSDLTDLSVLPELPNVRALAFYETNFVDLAQFSQFPDLESLTIAGSGLTDLDALPVLDGLSELALIRNELTDVSHLINFPHLSNLVLDDNPNLKVETLASHSDLKFLNLENAGISDLSHLAQFPNLNSLWLGKNEIESLEDMPHLPELRFLSLSHNRISDLSTFKTPPHLTSLFVTDQEVVLDAVRENEVVPNPVLDLDGDPLIPTDLMAPEGEPSKICVDEQCSEIRYENAGEETSLWYELEDDAAGVSVEFSGRIIRDVHAADRDEGTQNNGNSEDAEPGGAVLAGEGNPWLYFGLGAVGIALVAGIGLLTRRRD